MDLSCVSSFIHSSYAATAFSIIPASRQADASSALAAKYYGKRRKTVLKVNVHDQAPRTWSSHTCSISKICKIQFTVWDGGPTIWTWQNSWNILSTMNKLEDVIWSDIPHDGLHTCVQIECRPTTAAVSSASEKLTSVQSDRVVAMRTVWSAALPWLNRRL